MKEMAAFVKLTLVLACLFCPLHAVEVCTIEGNVRIISTLSFNNHSGRVEACHNGLWGTIATSGLWSEKNAQVACRIAGFDGALNSVFTTGSSVRQSNVVIRESATVAFLTAHVLSRLSFSDMADSTTPVHYFAECLGTESSLTECTLTDVPASFMLTSTTYAHILDVFVVCRPPLTLAYSPIHLGGAQTGDIRLLGDISNGRGAVEIFTSQFQWVSICPDGFDDHDAAILCSRLGYEGGVRRLFSLSSSSIGSRSLYDAQCTEAGPNLGLITNRIIAGVCSFEVDLIGCPSGSTQYAGVDCYRASASQGSVRLFGGDDFSGVLETLYDGKWGLVCSDGSFDTIEAQTVCTELGFYAPESSYGEADSNLLVSESNLKPIWLNRIDCTEESSRLVDCGRQTSQIIGYSPCTTGHIIVEVRCGTQFSAGEIVGMVIGIPAGLIIIFVIAWFAGLNKHWENYRNKHPHLRSCKACCDHCGTQCGGACAAIQSCWSSCTASCKRAAEERRARRVAAEERRAARRAAEEEERRAAQIAAETQRQQAIQQAEIELHPTAPPRAMGGRDPEKGSEFTKTGPPQYTGGIGFQPIEADLPPPYTEAIGALH